MIPRFSDPIVDQALKNAMSYFDYTGAAVELELEELCEAIILVAYQRGERDCVKLSNSAIDGLEQSIEDGELGPSRV
jgi:hypothetical protein